MDSLHYPAHYIIGSCDGSPTPQPHRLQTWATTNGWYGTLAARTYFRNTQERKIKAHAVPPWHYRAMSEQ